MSLPIPAPASTPAPTHGWTPERRALFLERLAAHGNVRAACRTVGLSAESAYRLRRRDAPFARGWAAAVVLGRDRTEQVLGERAVEGVEEQIYYRGELIGTRRRYDSRLLLAHLARLDRLVDVAGAGVDAGRFDEVLAMIAEGRDELLPEREETLQKRIDRAVEDFREEEEDAYWDARLDQSDGTPDEYAIRQDYRDWSERLDARCEEYAEIARVSAQEEYEADRQLLFARIDSLAERITPAGPHPVPPILASAAKAVRPARTARRFMPCTVSTVSTSALALGLAARDAGAAGHRFSPFDAPRGAPT